MQASCKSISQSSDDPPQIAATTFRGKSPPDTIVTVITRKQKASSAFERIEEGLYRRNNRIFARLKVDGKMTWRSTKSNHLGQARKWKEKRDREQWLKTNGFLPTETAKAVAKTKNEDPTNAITAITDASESTGCNNFTVDAIIDQYIDAGHPIIKKRALKRKAERTVLGEKYCINPIRAFFGGKDARLLTLAECDAYHQWRNSGGYIAKFKLRGKNVTRQTRGGDRVVDLELVVLRNALELAVRRGQLKQNPLADRGQYTDESTVRHCRDVSPTPIGLVLIVGWLQENGFQQDADFAQFLAYTGLRIGEGLAVRWASVDWGGELIHVKRAKKGVFPFVLLLPELTRLLRRMERKASGTLLFPSLFDPETPRDDSNFRLHLKRACKELKLPHVTPQGLRSYFVTQARQSGLTDAEIAQLIGDKSGPVLIAEVYGDVRPDHLLAIARKIRLTATTRKLRLRKMKSQRVQSDSPKSTPP